jgi:hypothetical protein
MLILNAFSLNMVQTFPATVSIAEVEYPLDLINQCGYVSAIGHQDTANVLTDLLELDIPMNRINVSLGRGDSALVAQYTGGRLPEGATTLPEGASFKWLLVTVL